MCMFMNLVVYVYVNVYAYIHTYVHTYIHTYRQTDRQTDIQSYIHICICTYAYAISDAGGYIACDMCDVLCGT